METYTYDSSELLQLRLSTVSYAGTSEVEPSRDGDGQIVSPIRPIQIDRVTSGPAGADWVRYVAEYQDNPAVGYATLDDLLEAHWLDGVDLFWEQVSDEETTSADVLASVRESQLSSELCWEMAIETAGPSYDGGSSEAQARMQALSDACDASYDAAIETLEALGEGWRSEVRGHLLDAQRSEAEGGDSGPATEALAEVAKCTE